MTGPENPHAPWKLPYLVPLWIIQTILPLVYLLGVPVVALNRNQTYGRGIDMWTGVIMAFSIFSIATNAVEISMFRSRKLNTRTYLISQWAKGAAAGVVWVIIEIFWFTGPWYMKAAGSYSVWNFVFQHPAILAGLYYASRAYSKYGGDAGADGPSQSAGEAAPLLMDHDEEV